MRRTFGPNRQSNSGEEEPACYRASQFLICIKYYAEELSRKSALKPGSQTRQLQLLSQQSYHIYWAGVHKTHMPSYPSDQILYGGTCIYGSSLWNLLHVTFLPPRISRLDLGKCVPC